jgi:hypothetical protein
VWLSCADHPIGAWPSKGDGRLFVAFPLAEYHPPPVATSPFGHIASTSKFAVLVLVTVTTVSGPTPPIEAGSFPPRPTTGMFPATGFSEELRPFSLFAFNATLALFA